ncbi:hypothetical protein [Fictibacillus enclensis]|uniref:hypothetical protein n=1 Tax=Fictibacillus enclensis TaxID=1017270 RepID=UPI0024C03C40|nr:hypothetical protein [Fictibacillus enclensis]WHY74637.1 hypothetical protein QNH15_12330 [Fictibacillus enclensis]
MSVRNPDSHLFKIPNCQIEKKEYQIVSQYYEGESFVYRTFIVTQSGAPYLLYELAITYEAVYKLSQFFPLYTPAFLLPLGLNFVYDMLKAPCPRHTSSLITKEHISSLAIHWRSLPPITDPALPESSSSL